MASRLPKTFKTTTLSSAYGAEQINFERRLNFCQKILSHYESELELTSTNYDDHDQAIKLSIKLPVVQDEAFNAQTMDDLSLEEDYEHQGVNLAEIVRNAQQMANQTQSMPYSRQLGQASPLTSSKMQSLESNDIESEGAPDKEVNDEY